MGDGAWIVAGVAALVWLNSRRGPRATGRTTIKEYEDMGGDAKAWLEGKPSDWLKEQPAFRAPASTAPAASSAASGGTAPASSTSVSSAESPTTSAPATSPGGGLASQMQWADPAEPTEAEQVDAQAAFSTSVTTSSLSKFLVRG